MERYGPLARDPLRLVGGESLIRAHHRLEALGDRMGLGGEKDGVIAALTRSRLVTLTEPANYEEGLADVLGRGSDPGSGVADAVTPRLPSRAVGAIRRPAPPPAGLEPRVGAGPHRGSPERRVAAGAPGSGRNGELGGTTGADPLARAQPSTRAASPRTVGARLRPQAGEGGESRGLGWLAARVLGGAVAAETSLAVEDETETRRAVGAETSLAVEDEPETRRAVGVETSPAVSPGSRAAMRDLAEILRPVGSPPTYERPDRVGGDPVRAAAGEPAGAPGRHHPQHAGTPPLATRGRDAGPQSALLEGAAAARGERPGGPAASAHIASPERQQSVGQLAALVGGWRDGRPAFSGAERSPPWVDGGSTADSADPSWLADLARGAGAGEPRAGQDLASVADALGRVLAAELARYGIEVDEG